MAVPTTILVDKYGVVRFLFRPRNVASRLSVREVLAAMDKKLGVPIALGTSKFHDWKTS